MSLPYLTECDQPVDDTCPRCHERGGMAAVALAFGIIFAFGAGILVGLKIGYQTAVVESAR